MVKFYLTTLTLIGALCGVALAEDPSPIPPPSPIAPVAPPTATSPSAAPSAPAPMPPAPRTTTTTTTTTSPEQPAPIEPPIQAVPAPGADQQAPVATGTTPGAAAAGTTAATQEPAISPDTPRAVNEFQGDDLNQVFRLLARQAKISLIVSDKVTGTVTTRLLDKTPIQSIEIIANSKNLIFEEDKNGVYYIKTQEEKAKEPTVSAFYTFSYADAGKVAPLLAAQLQGGVPPQIDIRTNTIFYRETKSNLDNIKLFLATIDQPTKQVMIEARLVEVTAEPQQAYGINWAGVVGSFSTPQTVTYGATVQGASTTTPTGPFAVGDPNSASWLKAITHLGSLATGQVAILSVPQMSVAMQFLNNDADAEFLANPRIVTANNQKATIKIIRNQPVPQLNFNEQTATAVFGGFEDKTFGNTLVVTPQINKDDFITMLVQPEISNKVADATFTFAGATVASPIIDTRTIESNVLIKSGDTLAIGGLLQDQVTKTRNKVPVLGDIPVVGYAFQSHQNDHTKRNLLVFVTPTIIHQGYGTGLEDQVSGLYHSGEEYADPNGWRNNARGAYRLVPTSNRPMAADYPKPGAAPAPEKVNYKVNATDRDE